MGQGILFPKVDLIFQPQPIQPGINFTNPTFLLPKFRNQRFAEIQCPSHEADGNASRTLVGICGSLPLTEVEKLGEGQPINSLSLR